MKKKFIITIILSITLGLSARVIEVKVPAMPTDTLNAHANFSEKEINESSTIVKSRNFPDLFWTLNDSGDSARIFPFNANGEAYYPEWDNSNSEMRIPDAVNIDWESMTADDKGNLIIGACGNNTNMRRDLALYVVPEPTPTQANKTRVLKTIFFRYPDQEAYPPEKRNFDCEAIFFAKGKYYLLSKHRSDSHTKLYRLDKMESNEINELTLISEFDIQGMVTDADASIDGKRLAVLTYNNIWLFEADTPEEFFTGKISYKEISAKQCEAICFDNDDLLITNEQTEIFRLPISALTKIK